MPDTSEVSPGLSRGYFRFMRTWKFPVLRGCLLALAVVIFLYSMSSTWPTNRTNLVQLMDPGSGIVNSPSQIGVTEPKLILYWTEFFVRKDFYAGFGDTPFKGCPIKSCRTTNNRSLLNLSDAVVFHAANLRLADMPPYRLPHQRWIFFYREPPIHTGPLYKFANAFNWTMTYRMDSDVPHPYGTVSPFPIGPSSRANVSKGTEWTSDLRLYRGLKSSLSEDVQDVRFDYDTFIKNKKKHVAWFVSDCVTTSGREKYVKKLRQFIDIDIYGKCGNLSCDNRPLCTQMLNKDYKFYIAFENSLCVDYVTEKYFDMLKYGVVPIVFEIEAHRNVGLTKSYINADSSESPEALANYLHVLLRNDTLYKEHLQWNDNFRPSYISSWCVFCQMLNDPKQGVSMYTDLHSWWFSKGNCQLRG